MKKLNGLTEIYKFFRTYKKPIYFVSASPMNILGLGQLVPTLRYINYFDCFDGTNGPNPRIFIGEADTK